MPTFTPSAYDALPQTPQSFPNTPGLQSETSSMQMAMGMGMPSPGYHIRKQIEDEKLSRGDHILKRRIRILRFVARLLATIIAVPTLVLETLTLTSFYHTHDTIRDGRGPWAKQTSLWPSIMLVAASATTVLLGLIILAAYLWGSVKAANNVNSAQTTVTVVVEVIHLGIWAAVAVLYRKGKTGKDLWGWACSELADKIQENFEGVVNFEKVCNRGTTNWGLSIANAAFTIFSLSIWYFVLQRRSYRQVQKQLSQRALLDNHNNY